MSSYVESVIGEGEKVEYIAKISVKAMIPSIIIAVLCMTIGLFTVILPIIGVVILVKAFMDYKTTELVITNKQVIAKFGLITRDTVELLLSRVESVKVQQGIFGRMFDFGSIVVSGTGGANAPIPGIDNPIKFKKKIMEMQDRVAGK